MNATTHTRSRTRTRRFLAAALVAALSLGSAQAFGQGDGHGGGAGHNKPTRALEAAFKVAQFERKESADGCYPGPDAMAAAIRASLGVKVLLAQGFKQARQREVIYVIRQGSKCGQMRMTYRTKADLYVLDAAKGLLEIVGPKPPPPGGGGPLRALKMTSKSFTLTRADEVQRLTVLCPGKTYPMGGGMIGSPAPSGDGEGAYPHSYERLGAQRGWHVNPVLVDPSGAQTTARKVTLQVVCGKGLVPTSSPHKTVFIKSGQTKTATATCPKGSQLMSGGFQRTNFRTPDGNYVTESRAVGSRAWRVTGSAFGGAGGELTSIGYCDRSKRPLLRTVKATSPIPAGALATATTPKCPKGTVLTSGGFDNASSNALFAAGFFNKDGTWTAQSFGYFGPAPTLTAYGYCLRPGI